MNQKERMLAELPYKAWMDGLAEEQMENKKRIYEYNLISPDRTAERDRLLRSILGSAGKGIVVESPFHCDYGYTIEVGDFFFANYNCVILDVGKVKIGNHVQFAPNVSIYTAGHPIHPDSRNSGYEYGLGITIGDKMCIRDRLWAALIRKKSILFLGCPRIIPRRLMNMRWCSRGFLTCTM